MTLPKDNKIHELHTGLEFISTTLDNIDSDSRNAAYTEYEKSQENMYLNTVATIVGVEAVQPNEVATKAKKQGLIKRIVAKAISLIKRLIKRFSGLYKKFLSYAKLMFSNFEKLKTDFDEYVPDNISLDKDSKLRKSLDSRIGKFAHTFANGSVVKSLDIFTNYFSLDLSLKPVSRAISALGKNDREPLINIVEHQAKISSTILKNIKATNTASISIQKIEVAISNRTMGPVIVDSHGVHFFGIKVKSDSAETTKISAQLDTKGGIKDTVLRKQELSKILDTFIKDKQSGSISKEIDLMNGIYSEGEKLISDIANKTSTQNVNVAIKFNTYMSTTSYALIKAKLNIVGTAYKIFKEIVDKGEAK